MVTTIWQTVSSATNILPNKYQICGQITKVGAIRYIALQPLCLTLSIDITFADGKAGTTEELAPGG